MKRLTRTDREALTRAVKLVRSRPKREDPGRREQIDQLIAEEGLFTAADFCATSCQRKDLKIRMWQPAPCEIPVGEIDAILARGDDTKSGHYAAAKLLKKMLALGLSRFEPTPIAAISEAKAKRAAAHEPEVAA
jgi:hypothetical protein